MDIIDTVLNIKIIVILIVIVFSLHFLFIILFNIKMNDYGKKQINLYISPIRYYNLLKGNYYSKELKKILIVGFIISIFAYLIFFLLLLFIAIDILKYIGQ